MKKKVEQEQLIPQCHFWHRDTSWMNDTTRTQSSWCHNARFGCHSTKRKVIQSENREYDAVVPLYRAIAPFLHEKSYATRKRVILAYK